MGRTTREVMEELVETMKAYETPMLSEREHPHHAVLGACGLGLASPETTRAVLEHAKGCSFCALKGLQQVARLREIAARTQAVMQELGVEISASQYFVAYLQ